MNRGPQITRRSLLRGLGAAIALPWLEIMDSKPAFRLASQANPIRMACLYFPNGVWMESWFPQEAGHDYQLPYSLQPLENFKTVINVFSNLDKAKGKTGDGYL